MFIFVVKRKIRYTTKHYLPTPNRYTTCQPRTPTRLNHCFQSALMQNLAYGGETQIFYVAHRKVSHTITQLTNNHKQSDKTCTYRRTGHKIFFRKSYSRPKGDVQLKGTMRNIKPEVDIRESLSLGSQSYNWC